MSDLESRKELSSDEEVRPKRLVRVMKEIIISNDDTLPTRISYPSILTPDEFRDLKAVVDIWLRQLERQSIQAGKLLDAIFWPGDEKS